MRTELDDDLLLKIFSKVGCAREIAKLSLVCKRWRDLSCSVSYLAFHFETASVEELKNKESIISGVLCRANSRAPGSLKHLRVSLKCNHCAEATCHWLLWTPSLTKLDLDTDSVQFEWGPVVWNTIVRMKAVENLMIRGRFRTESHMLLPHVLANGLQMTRLWKCYLSGNYLHISVALLEAILSTCPELAELHADLRHDGLALRVASNSLKILSLVASNYPERFEATVDAPSLTSLYIRGPFSNIYFESAQSLRRLDLHCPWSLHNPPDNLRELWIAGTFDVQQLPQMLMLTPMITDLRLDMRGEGRINIDDILAPLVNLRNIELLCKSMLRLKSGERRLEALHVHVWPSSEFLPGVRLLRALLEIQKIQSLVVHSQGMMNFDTRRVNRGHDKWLFLFELSVFYPDRVKFTRKRSIFSELIY